MGRRVAEAVEAGPPGRGPAVAVVTGGVRLGGFPPDPGVAWSRLICWSMARASALPRRRWSRARIDRDLHRSPPRSVSRALPAIWALPQRGFAGGPSQEPPEAVAPPTHLLRCGPERSGRPPVVSHGRLPRGDGLEADGGPGGCRPGSGRAAGSEDDPAAVRAELVVCDWTIERTLAWRGRDRRHAGMITRTGRSRARRGSGSARSARCPSRLGAPDESRKQVWSTYRRKVPCPSLPDSVSVPLLSAGTAGSSRNVNSSSPVLVQPLPDPHAVGMTRVGPQHPVVEPLDQDSV